MKLERLNLKNFKGMTYTFSPGGHSANIYGQNKTGKTTLADAYLWLLTGKDTLQRSKFEIKTLNPDGSGKAGEEHSVEGVFRRANGTIVVLKKTYTEKLTSKRGRAIPVLTGHSTDYTVDGIGVDEKAFRERIEETAREEIWKLLTSPMYFSNDLHWEQRRNILISLCGDVKDEEVIASKPELSRYLQVLGFWKTKESANRALNETKIQTKKELSKVNTSLEEAKKRIEREVSDEQFTEAQKSHNHYEAEIEALAQKIYALTFSDALAAKKQELAEAEKGEMMWKLEQRDLGNEIIREKEEGLRAEEKSVKEAQECASKNAEAIKEKKDSIKKLEFQKEELLNAFYQIADQTEKEDGECPECGRVWNKDLSSQIRRKRRADINKKGKSVSEMISATSVEIIEMEKQQKVLDDITSLKLKDHTMMEGEIENIRNNWIPLPSIHTETISNIRREIEELESGQPQDQVLLLRNNILKAKEEQDRARKIINARKENLKAHKRIQEILGEQNGLALQHETACQDEILIEKFTRAKVALLEPRFHAKFNTVRFKLIHQPISGETQDTCEVLVGGVPFSTNLNHGSCILAGLEIIAVLSDFYGICLPLWVDNAEALTDAIPDVPGQQVFCLYAERGAEELRVVSTKLELSEEILDFGLRQWR